MSHGIKKLQKPIRVGFFLIGGSHWMGGYNYLINLLSLLQLKNDEINPVLFLGNDLEEKFVKELETIGCQIVYSDSCNISNRTSDMILSMITGRNNKIKKLLEENNVDVLFEAEVFFGWNFDFPTLSWIPDFQHKHLKQLFSRVGQIKRDILFWMISTSRTVMLSSNDAKEDYYRYYNSDKNRSYVVPFAVRTPIIDDSIRKDVFLKYKIETPYFFLPNQYWIHKNHKLVIEALKLLKEEGVDIKVISSGGCTDKRNMQLCDSLKEMVTNYNLRDNYIMLGSIPYQDVMLLAKNACAIINPSYFEGWSSTVEEAKSLNIPLILSNLNVHIEQVGKEGLYFSLDSPDELASILKEFSCLNSKVNYGYKTDQRLDKYINNFINAIKLAYNNF